VQAAVKHIRQVPDQSGELAGAGELAEGGDLETLFRRHCDLVFRTAHRITGSIVDAEDVLQTVFLRLAQANKNEENDKSYDLTPNPFGYLHRAAVNASLDVIRGRVRAKHAPIDDIEQLEGSAGNPQTEREDRELSKLVQEAVSRLSPKTAEMFILRYYEGHNNREIAEMTGSSQMVVGVLLHRARTRLRKEIGEYLDKHHEA
jgi:RNA polymerase sigma factor (sigma-70 family)